jgi:hypothetical protein
VLLILLAPNQYHTIPGTNTVVPIMSFGNHLQKAPSRGPKHLGRDPIAEAAMKGRVPTLRDVKRSVKVRQSLNGYRVPDRVLL